MNKRFEKDISDRGLVLVVEDDDQFRELLQEILSHNGYNVITAANGIEGYEKYAHHQPDLIVTDIVMPLKEGIELIMQIRSKDETIPIVALSGYNPSFTDSYLRMAGKLGATSAFKKPFAYREFLFKINELCESRKGL
jgi:CheY-like chemotaxis protein